MIDAHKAIGAAISHKTEDKEHTKRLTAHFEAQSDLFTQCQSCGEHLTGTKATILAHRCFADLMGA